MLQNRTGQLTLKMRAVEAFSSEYIEQQELLVDEENLFEECQVDQNKYTIESSCEPGIALFCRHDVYPFMSTVEASKADFNDICNCIRLLCACLPSGETITQELNVFRSVIYMILTMVVLPCIGIYFYVLFDLVMNKKLGNCMLFFHASMTSNLIADCVSCIYRVESWIRSFLSL